MTNEEAIKTIEVAIAEVEWNYPMNYAIAFETAISAIEKQIPKKPILDTIFPSGVKWWRCPVCNKIIVGCIANRPQKYCSNCGQALKWRDSE